MAEEAEEDKIDDTRAPSATSTDPFEAGPSELELAAQARTARSRGASLESPSFRYLGERRDGGGRDRGREWQRI